MMIDLRKCKEGDTLITSQGSILEYVSTTPWKYFTYADHVVRYVKDKNGKKFSANKYLQMYGTRTNDGYVFIKNRIAETDHDVIKVIRDGKILQQRD